MAKPTIAELTKQLEEAEAKIKAFEESQQEPAEETVPKAEFDKLEQAHQNLSNEHDELVLKYESSPDLEKKIEKAIETLSGKGKALLFKKISLALGEVKRIPKNGWNEFHRYKYSQEGDILDGIRPILSEVGLMLWTTIVEDERKPVTYFKSGKEIGQRTITKVTVEFTIACADTGETLVSRYKGEGEDESDKGLYKAYTGATKYFLTKNFLISSGDILQDDKPSDPEADTTRRDELQDKRKQRQNFKEGQREEFKNQQPQEDPTVVKEKKEMLAVWNLLAGSDEGFEGFYNKQTKQKGASHAAILDFLNKSLATKQAEARQNEQEGEQSPPPDNEPPQEEQQQEAPPEPPNTGVKNTDDMTPEEYLAFVEDSVPFPLTPSEKEQILKDAREGTRNHGK